LPAAGLQLAARTVFPSLESIMSIAERLNTLQYTVDDTAHIAVDGEKCSDCGTHPCLNFCPARCFTPNAKGGIDYYYVGCVECGTCLILCKQDAIVWNYPRGGKGISYRF
jgi:ferredoxin like protein